MRNDEHFPSRTPLLKEAALAPPLPPPDGSRDACIEYGESEDDGLRCHSHSLTHSPQVQDACMQGEGEGEGVMKALNIGGAVAPKRVVRVKTSKHPYSSFHSNRGSLVNLLLMQQI